MNSARLFLIASGPILALSACGSKEKGDDASPSVPPGGSVHGTKRASPPTAPDGRPIPSESGGPTVTSPRETDAALATLGNGSKRHSLLQNAVNNYSPPDLCRMLVQNQGNLSPDDLDKLSHLTYKLSLLETDQLVAGLSQVQPSWLQAYFSRALTSRLFSLGNPTAYRDVALKIPGAGARRGFLIAYMAQAIAADPSTAFAQLETLKQLNPTRDMTGWYNQTIADIAGSTPPASVDAAWAHLSEIGDMATRHIAATQLFAALYDSDSLAATAWLNAREDGEAKQLAIGYLVEILTSSGDHEAAQAWKAALHDPTR